MYMNKEIQIFKNEKLNLKARAIQNEDGSISIDVEDTANGLGFIQKQNKNGRQYTSVRWETVHKYCEECGFPNKLGKGDFIPESLFYLLAMKANNKVAQEFQKWLAVDVIPQIRKTGSYTNNKKKSKSVDNSLKEKEIEARLKNARAREANILLKICNNPNLPKEYVQVLQSKATEIITGQAILPLPVVERKTYSATEIGEELGISANKVGKLANANNLKTDEYGLEVWDKAKHSNKEVPTFRYYDNVIPVLAEILSKGKVS